MILLISFLFKRDSLKIFFHNFIPQSNMNKWIQFYSVVLNYSEIFRTCIKETSSYHKAKVSLPLNNAIFKSGDQMSHLTCISLSTPVKCIDLKLEERFFRDKHSLNSIRFVNINVDFESFDLAFDGLINMESVSLINVGLKKITARCFSSMLGLKELLLHENQIEEIEMSSFSALKCLEKFSISLSNINNDVKLFDGLDNLKWLSLNRSDFTSLSLASKIYEQSAISLEYLELNYNQIYRIDDYSFKFMICLQTLYLNNNKIESVSSNAFDGLVNLQFLDLSNNSLTSLEPDLFNEPQVGGKNLIGGMAGKNPHH